MLFLSQWYIMRCLIVYCISIPQKSDISVTVMYHATFVCIFVQCISITQKIAISVTVIYHAMSLSMLYQYHSEESYFYHSDLSCYVSWYAVSVSLRGVIFLSQWFIKLCLLVYCISITKKRDMSVTVIYHAISLSILYQYHSEDWYVYHRDLLCYVS